MSFFCFGGSGGRNYQREDLNIPLVNLGTVMQFHVPTLCPCEQGCPRRVRECLKNVRGIKSIEVDSINKIVKITGNSFSAEDVRVCIKRKMKKDAILIQEVRPPLPTRRQPAVERKHEGGSSSGSTGSGRPVEMNDDDDDDDDDDGEGHIQIQDSSSEDDDIINCSTCDGYSGNFHY